MIRKVWTASAVLVLVLAAAAALAHTPLCSCWENGDGTVSCEGGFSDGSSAAGAAVRVVDENGKVLEEGSMDERGMFTFEKPEGPYKVILDAGPGHKVEVDGEDIF
ncbi:MAG: hypothetical protein R6X08_08915 [Desulfosalsimonadaceae bacterium]